MFLQRSKYDFFHLAICAILIILTWGCTTPVTRGKKRIDNIPMDYPEWGLALSGGGLRSGATAAGVLQELNDKKLLSKFRYVSSVSGGGYPVYGILDQLAHTDRSLDDILSEKDGGYLEHIDHRGILVSVYLLPLNALWLPVFYVLDGAGVGLTGQDNGFLRSGASYIYALNVDRCFKLSSKEIRFEQLREIHLRGFPEPIVVMASSKRRYAPILGFGYKSENIFEVSRRYMGSKCSMYIEDYSSGMSARDAYVASAAAPDANVKWYTAPLTILRVFKMGFGGSVRMPRGHYFLTDGGFIDNTGILPLLRRGCRNVVAVDASADRTGSFKMIHDFREIARTEGWIFTELATVEGRAHRSGDRIPRHALPSHVWRFEATKGALRSTIWVLKLGLNTSESDSYPDPVTYYHTKPLQILGKFPFKGTWDQAYGDEEFRAYRHLGKHLIRKWTELAPSVGDAQHIDLEDSKLKAD